MNKSNCGYCYRPDCAECNPHMVGHIGWGPNINPPLPLITDYSLAQTPTMTYTAVGLRDQMAMAALPGMLVRLSKDPNREPIRESEENCLAGQAYKYADAMMRAREK